MHFTATEELLEQHREAGVRGQDESHFIADTHHDEVMVLNQTRVRMAWKQVERRDSNPLKE